MNKVLRSILTIIFIWYLSIELQAQDANWGVGLRLGNPTGITAKKYSGASNALEIALGTSSNGNGFELLGHYLFHFPIGEAPGLDWYYGFGAQLQSHPRRSNDLDDEVDIGGDAVLGMEYTFQNAPVSVFMDGVFFIELIDDPFVLELDAGIGVRYNF